MTLIDKIELAVIYIQDRMKLPRFVLEESKNFDEIYEGLNQIIQQFETDFPFIYMSEEYKRKELIENNRYESNIVLWLVNKSNPSYTAEERREKEIDDLWAVESSLRDAIVINVGNYDEYETDIKYYKVEQTKYDTPLNVIKMTFSGLKYQIIEC